MKVKLGSFIKIMQGYAFKTKNYVKKSKFRLVTLGNFAESGNCFKYNNEKAIFYGADFPSKVILQEGDLILPLTEQVVGLFGNSAFVPNGDGFQFVLNQRVGKVILINDRINMNFLHYLLATDSVKKQLEARANGTKQRNISPDDIYDVVVDLPNINLQKKIGNLFYNIEKNQKINNQINTQLEELAKTIYDYWFLQFEFPNEEGKPYKSSGGKMVYNEQLKREIPEGWEVVMLSKISNMYQPNTFDAKLLKNNGKYMVYGAGGYMGQYDNYNHEEQEIFISCRGSCGNIYKSMPKSLITGNAMIVHPDNNIIFHYLYLTLIRYGVKQCITGTVQPQITRDNLKDWILILPPNEILKLFNLKINSINKKQNNIIYENQQLSSLRDFLLPLLMNGQVTFKDENEELESENKKSAVISYIERFNQWKQMQGYAARGDVDNEILMKIFDAMDEDDKK